MMSTFGVPEEWKAFEQSHAQPHSTPPHLNSGRRRLRGESRPLREFAQQDVAGWGTWTFQYTTDEKSRVIQTDMVNPDGLHERTLYNRDGYPVRDTSSPDRQNEQITVYERMAGTNVVVRLSVKCRAPDGAPVNVSATVAATETDDTVRRRLLKGCAR